MIRRIRLFLTKTLHDRPVLAFILMGASFVLFGLTSLNLLYLIRANVYLFVDYGWMVVRDGALRQLGELLLLGYLSLVFYLLFKCCEHQLINYLTYMKGQDSDE